MDYTSSPQLTSHTNWRISLYTSYCKTNFQFRVTDRGRFWLEHSRLHQSFYTGNTSQNSNFSNKVCISQFLSPCDFFPPLKTIPKHECSTLGRGICVREGCEHPPESPLWSGHRKYSAQLHISRDLLGWIVEYRDSFCPPCLRPLPTAFEAKQDTY